MITLTNETAAAKLDAIIAPGSEVTVNPQEAAILGAFVEDALSYQEAKDSIGSE